MVNLLANIAVINKSKRICIFLYFFLISFFLNFQISQETFRKFCCENFPSFQKLSRKLRETAWKFSTLLIINLNTIGKILERLVFFSHFKISHFFLLLQFAYRKFHSTETALLELTNDIMETIDSGKITMLTALDIKLCPQP